MTEQSPVQTEGVARVTLTASMTWSRGDTDSIHDLFRQRIEDGMGEEKTNLTCSAAGWSRGVLTYSDSGTNLF